MKIHFSILLLSAALTAMADPESDSSYFHPAASMYIHGESSTASNLVAQGLSLFPEDGKLLRLKELLDQQQEDQENKEKQENQEQQENQDQDKPKDEPQDQENPEEPPEDEPNENPNQDPEQQDQAQEPEPPKAEQMSQDEAERLLDAMKQEEENKRLQMHPVMGRPVKVDKDW